MPRVNGTAPGSPRSAAGSSPRRSSGPYEGRISKPEVDRNGALSSASEGVMGHRFYRCGRLGPMPASAYGLVALFILLSAASGVVGARLVGPWRAAAAVLPALAAFGALYLVGHRWVLSIGPNVEVLGWDVALPFDTAVALGVAAVTALLQRAAVRLFQSQQRRSGSDSLA